MTAKTKNQEYENAKKEIEHKYDKGTIKRIKYGFLPGLGLLVLGGISYAVALFDQGMTKASLENQPIYREFKDNQSSLSYLREQLSKYSQNHPQFLSEEIKKDLSSIPLSSVDSAKVSVLEKAIRTAEKDSLRITNSQEYKELIERMDENNNAYDSLPSKILKGSLGAALLLVLSSLGFESYQNRRKKREIENLKTKYKINGE